MYTVKDKLALDAAYFKFSASHAAIALFVLPGSNKLLGRCLFRLKNIRNPDFVKSSKNIIDDTKSLHWVWEIISVSILSLISWCSIDTKSQDWIHSLSPHQQKLAFGMAIHPATSVQSYFPVFYRRLHSCTKIKGNYHVN